MVQWVKTNNWNTDSSNQKSKFKVKQNQHGMKRSGPTQWKRFQAEVESFSESSSPWEFGLQASLNNLGHIFKLELNLIR